MRFFLVAVLLIATVACTDQSEAPKRLRDAVDWQGHRGARGLAPENTLAAFIKAVDLGVTTLELDVVVSKDSQLIVSHEPWFNPEICGGTDGEAIPESPRLFIIEMTVEEIRQIDCGQRQHPRFPEQQNLAQYKPTLAEVVDSVRRYCAAKRWPVPRWNIETKWQPTWHEEGLVPDAETFARLLVSEVKRLKLSSSTTVQSFATETLEVVHREAPTLYTCLLVENTQGLEANLARLSYTAPIYSPYHELVNREMVATCHTQGIQVVPWTVNDTTTMQKLLDMGVDGLISDYPDRFAQLDAYRPIH